MIAKRGIESVPRVLIVDDDVTFSHAIARTLGRSGYETDEVSDGREAMDRYRAAPADLVITDMYMPGIDGIEMIVRLRAEFPDARVIALSGGGHMDSEDVLVLAAKLGAQATLAKPVSGDALLRLVRQVSPQ